MSAGRHAGYRTVKRALAAGALVVAFVSIGALGVLGGVAATPAGAAPSRVDRVLVLSLPAVVWSDLDRVVTPNLHRLFTGSALGSLATNGVLTPSPIGDSYVTLGASAPATPNVDPLVAGQGFGADEMFGGDTAGRVFTTRTGVPVASGIVYMPIGNVTETNAAESYDAHRFRSVTRLPEPECRER